MDELEETKRTLIAALYSNSAYDEAGVDRSSAIREIEDSHQDAVNDIYDPQPEDLYKKNPFYKDPDAEN